MLSRLRNWFRRLEPAVGLFPVTPLGIAVLAVSYGVLQGYGYAERDLVLFALGALGVLLVGVALLVAVVGAFVVHLAIRRSVNRTSGRLECDRWSPSGFGFAAPFYVPLLTVAWRWEGLAVEVRQRRIRRRLEEDVRPRRRGHATVIVRRIEVGDAFGLARIDFRHREAREVELLPSVGALRQPQVIRGLAAGSERSDADGRAEGDPFDTRRYAPGDPIRHVLWKVFAKSRVLIVRTPERALSPEEHTVAYLVAGAGDEPSAGAARIALDVGAFGDDWRIGADGSRTLARSREEAISLLTQSANVAESESGRGLGPFLEEAGHHGRLVVFVPPRPGPWLARVTTLVRERRRQVDFVVGTDGFDASTRLSRLLERDAEPLEGPRATPIDDLRSVVRALGAGSHGTRVVIVDRRTGHAYLPEQLPRSATAVGGAP